MDYLILSVLGLLAVLTVMGVKIVPQQQVWVNERLGKFENVLYAGMHFIIPFIDKIAYKHTLKERAIDVTEQTAITKDNVTLQIDGIVYLRITDPKGASYGVENLYFAVVQLAQTSMRSAIGKITLDKTFEEREALNIQIVQAINDAASTWGIQCMRYEIRDIKPPINVLKAMELQMAAERQKRAAILESEGKQQAQINLSEADKQQIVLNSEAMMIDQINRAKGQAEAILTIAESTALSLDRIGTSIGKEGGKEAVTLRVAEKYVDAFAHLAKNNNTLIIPANANDASSMVIQALSIFDSIRNKTGKNG